MPAWLVTLPCLRAAGSLAGAIPAGARLQAANTAYGEADVSKYGYGDDKKEVDCICAKSDKRDIYQKEKCDEPKTAKADKKFEVSLRHRSWRHLRGT